MKKNCENCGHEYQSNDKRKMYCSDTCKTKAYNKRMALKDTLPVSMTMEKGIVKTVSLNPAYEKAKSKLDILKSKNRWDESDTFHLSSRITQVQQTKKHKLHWQAGYGLLGAFGGLIFGNLIAKPFMKEKITNTRHKGEDGSFTTVTQRVGLPVWQILGLFVVVGVGLALWLFDRDLGKREAQIPEQEEQIDRLKDVIAKRSLSIETATKRLELIPKFDLPEPTV